MARSRRAPVKRARVRKDWVMNPFTYVSSNITLPSGVVGSTSQPLTFSQQAQRQIAFGADNALAPIANIFSSAAFPERGGQQVFMVKGEIHVEPSAWAAGNFVRFGWRLYVSEQDMQTGGAVNAVNYSMFQDGGTTDAYQWANDGFLAERRLYRDFGDGDVGWQVPVFWSSRRGIRIGPNRALFIHLEGSADSVSLRVRPYLRTLMRVP